VLASIVRTYRRPPTPLDPYTCINDAYRFYREVQAKRAANRSERHRVLSAKSRSQKEPAPTTLISCGEAGMRKDKSEKEQ
jgi:hypothetical protein